MFRKCTRTAFERFEVRLRLHEAARSYKASWALGAEGSDSQVRKKIKTPPDISLDALRHSFLTEPGKHTDPFTLQYVAGHDNIKATMRYVHPREAAVDRLFARLADLQWPVSRRV